MRGLDPAVFDCLRVARNNYPSTLRKAYLIDFLGQAQKTGCEAQDVSSFVASAILIDAYPPGAHCEFDPTSPSATCSCLSWLTILVFNLNYVFDELYRSNCTDTWTIQNINISLSEFCDRVLALFTDLFKLIDLVTLSTAVRRRSLSRFY